ncbi:protein translocase subunit SecY [Clostridium sp. CAG:762]|jgi:preprotein translocase subunit SecY|nr:protein translocase subunit SecY [Clostridium sp. CAG:762]
MFKNLRQIWNPKNKDIKKRIGYTLFALLIFAVGNTITVPGMKAVVQDLGFLEYLNAISGGGLKRFTIFGLGVMPYISASIVVSILQMDMIPYFSDLKNDGAKGRQKLNQITRYLGIIIAFFQGFAMVYAFGGKNLSAMEIMKSSIVMTAGTSFLLWLGDRITQKGLGNGISLIIMAGIISTVPKMFIDAFTSLVTDNSSLLIGIVSYAVFVIIYLLLVVAIVFVEESERRIPIQYSNQTTSAYGAKQTYIPFKLNSAGVMPVILASAVISVPAFLASIMKKEGFTLFVEKYLTYTTPVGFIVYILLIFVFGFFYTILQANPEELAKNLNKNGGYIPGIRPGKETTTYIKTVLKRLTLVGTLFLAILAGLPIIFSAISNLPSSVSIGGTGMLIVIGVALETYRQLESSLVNRNYKGGK